MRYLFYLLFAVLLTPSCKEKESVYTIKLYNNNTVLVENQNIHINSFERDYDTIHKKLLEKSLPNENYQILLEVEQAVKMGTYNKVIGELKSHNIEKILIKKVPYE